MFHYWTACNNVKRYCMVPYTVMNIERNFEATLWRHRWRHHHKKLFCGIIWDALFIFEVRLKLCLTFQNFQNGRHFELDKLIFPEVIPEVERCNSNINGGISISKFDLFCDLVTSSMTSWIYIHIIVVIISWYICTGSLLMISLLVF